MGVGSPSQIAILRAHRDRDLFPLAPLVQAKTSVAAHRDRALLVTMTCGPAATDSGSTRTESGESLRSALVRMTAGTAPLCHPMARYLSTLRTLTSVAATTTNVMSTLAASTCCFVSVPEARREKTARRSRMAPMTPPLSATQSPTAGSTRRALARFVEHPS